MSPVIGGILIWVLCGVWGYGRNLAYWQGRFPEIRSLGDVSVALFVGVCGPLGLLGSFFFGGYGMQFRPKPREQSMISTRIGYTNKCPGCGHSCHVTSQEREIDSWLCVYCRNYFRLSTGESVPFDLEDDEPDWSEPSEAEVSWAQATMPGKATGHMLAWRTWGLHMAWDGGEIDRARLSDFVNMTETEILDRFAEFHREIGEARDKPRWLLMSGNGHVWRPHEPMMGYRVADMPRAHGAGIYALKESPENGEVYGQVALWGSVVEHKAGYRARYAYPVKLWARSEEVAESLRKAYDVPCEVDSRERFVGRTQAANAAALQQIQRQILQAQQQVLRGGLGGSHFGGLFPRI